MDHEADHRGLSDPALQQAALDLRKRLAGLDRPDASVARGFALVREASRRSLGQSHTVSQLMGGLAMHDRCIAEMPTGEGKTLAATLVCTMQALAGHSVHVAAPNDYLSARDAAWMRPVYETLGLSVGLITSDMDDDTRRRAYACDVTYGSASELAFDFLRDNTTHSLPETVQRGHDFALVDEADAVLIDDAGMPLSLYGPLGDFSALYRGIDGIVAALGAAHYRIDERRHVHLTEIGYDRVQRALAEAGIMRPDTSLHMPESISLLHHVMQALRARALLMRDRDYIVRNGEVIIVDPSSGRLMEGRRFDDSLHQALEAKENCAIGAETRTTDAISFQSFFRRYRKLAGMTATAAEDADEYRQVYGLDVIPIPPNRPCLRVDQSIRHATREQKVAAIVAQVEDAHARRQPVLIGAPTIARAEQLAAVLEGRGWTAALRPGARTYALLTAKHHEHEAQIIAQAGCPDAVTIATAMAGRGTDIRLGGSTESSAARQQVIDAGGLLVIGSEHHELARLDRQLRGRAGRQGDPGRTVFHASFEDDVMGDQAPPSGQRRNSGVDALTTAIAASQTRFRNRKYEDRRTVMRFDNIVEAQRATILAQRAVIQTTADPISFAKELRDQTIDNLMAKFAGVKGAWDMSALDASVRAILTLAIEFPSAADHVKSSTTLRNMICDTADEWVERKVSAFGSKSFAETVRTLMLALIDHLWMEQIERLEHLRRMIGDRRLAAQAAVIEFEREAFPLLKFMITEFGHEVTAHVMRLGLSESSVS